VEPNLSTGWTYHGLSLITLENRFLRVQIMPQAGGRIWQITYKPEGVDLLWNNPRIPPRQHAIHTPYDDVWSGGWDELFPVDEESRILGERYPDHGEFWTGQWDAEPFSNQGEVGLVLRFQTPISCIEVKKTITLRGDDSQLFFTHLFTNRGGEAFPFLWKLHPAFNVSDQHRIDFPAMQVVREPAFVSSLDHAPLQFAWPYAQTSAGEIDLRRVPKLEERQLYFLYGTQMQDGWCAITNTLTGLSCGLHFDPAVFPSCWLFASYGGWRNYNVAVLEPCTGYPLNFEALLAAGRQRILQPGECLSTDVLFTVQQGIQGVSAVHADGSIVADTEEQFSAR
jgi:galactose mutarotase-like enzyme